MLVTRLAGMLHMSYSATDDSLTQNDYLPLDPAAWQPFLCVLGGVVRGTAGAAAARSPLARPTSPAAAATAPRRSVLPCRRGTHTDTMAMGAMYSFLQSQSWKLVTIIYCKTDSHAAAQASMLSDLIQQNCARRRE